MSGFVDIIKNIAPIIAGTFGTPLAGMAVGAIIDAVPPEHGDVIKAALSSGGIEGAIAKIQELLTNGSIQAADIKKAEMAHAERMAELGYKNAADLAKIAADDRDSARKMQTETKSILPPFLACLIVALYVAVQWFLLTGVIDNDMREIVMRSLGTLDASLGLVLSFYFGSSASSRAKDETIQASVSRKGL